MKNFNYFTSEFVSPGHPDKISDQIADSILDACLKDDPNSRVACEVFCTTGLVVVGGEITTSTYIDVQDIVRKKIDEIGYKPGMGFDSNCGVLNSIHAQSPDIAMGVDIGGAGDQGIMFGGAVRETEELNEIEKTVIEKVVKPVLEKYNLSSENIKYYINPTGRFVIGGPHGDTGVTGRKIIVDTYGGYFRHGGGAFSGKDPSKVDRSAAYAARWVAKNVVAANLADKCEIQLSYAIGVPHPVSIKVETFGTSKVDEYKISEAISKIFDLSPRGIEKALELREGKFKYQNLAAYGHIGRTDIDTPF